MRLSVPTALHCILPCLPLLLLSCAGQSFQQSPPPAVFTDIYPACRAWAPISTASAADRAAAPKPSPEQGGKPPEPPPQNTPATICAAYLTKAVIDQCVYHSYETAKSVRYRNALTAVLAVGAIAAAPVALAAGATATTTALVASSTSGAGFALPSIAGLLPSQAQVSIEAMHKAEADYLANAPLNDTRDFQNLWDAIGSACPTGVLSGK